jgi:hypothetical protein
MVSILGGMRRRVRLEGSCILHVRRTDQLHFNGSSLQQEQQCATLGCAEFVKNLGVQTQVDTPLSRYVPPNLQTRLNSDANVRW